MEALCEPCQRLRPPFEKAVAYGVYEGTLRALIHLLKYEHVSAVAKPLGALLAQTIQAMPNLPQELTVVAVPLHPAKERQRGFNQTALLAEEAVRALRSGEGMRRFHIEHRVLRRKRVTESQSGLTPHQRRRNLRGAFFVALPEAIQNRAVLLLDDIYTTGATARECTRTLLAAGAASVHVATLARSQREGVAFWDAPSLHAGQAGNVPSLLQDF
ncbi:MAG TPA: ComF family protein [Acidobacteriaceae bacterium]|nr:ComF family protein [Acidobacteriaceae bacterium]